MNPFCNPFTEVGEYAPEHFGRISELELCRELFESTGQFASGRRIVYFTGLHGLGKTSILEKAETLAYSKGFMTSAIKAREGLTLPELFYPEMLKAARAMLGHPAANALALEAIECISDFGTGHHVEAAGFEAELSAVPTEEDEDDDFDMSGGLAPNLNEVIDIIGAAAHEADARWVVFIDDAEHLSLEECGSLLAAAQLIDLKHLPIAFVLAGLPQGEKCFREYVELCDAYFHSFYVEPLIYSDSRKFVDRALAEEGVRIDEDALDELATRCRGIPFILKVRAACAWDAAQGSRITKSDLHASAGETLRRLDVDFFRPLFNRLTHQEAQVCLLMAAMSGNGPCLTANIAKTLNRPISALAPVRAKLLAKGIIYPESRGYCSFTMPYFGNFLRRRVIPEMRSERVGLLSKIYRFDEYGDDIEDADIPGGCGSAAGCD